MNSGGGVGSEMKKCTNFDNARLMTTRILPANVVFLYFFYLSHFRFAVEFSDSL